MVMKINKTYLYFCIAAISLFFTGRCSRSKPVVIDNKHTIDSLTISARVSHNRALIAEANAHKAFKKGIESQKVKVIVRTIYNNKIIINHALSPSAKDSLIKKMFHVEYSDSSTFTQPIANGILDLGSESELLKANALIDSTSITELTGAYLQLDQALNESDTVSIVKDQIIIEERNTNKKLRKEIRRQKAFKWLAVGCIFVVTTLAISNK